LSADASGNVTTYLYGLGPIGQMTDTWAYGLPGCQSARVSVTKPLTLTVQDTDGAPKAGLPVYAFTLSGTGAGDTYTGYNGTTDANGQTLFTLPQGDYRFRADYDGVQFWSSEGNSCSLPGCTQDTVRLPGGAGVGTVTIDYNYDPLYRLIAADYDTGDYFHYTYDAVGNRLTQENAVQGLPATTTYTYDGANRLTSVNGVTYTWDANGNLLSDGVNTYAYDTANRLISFSEPAVSASFAYNGLNDRVQQIVNSQPTNYTLDLNVGLTQVLDDGTNTYLYGVDRIAQVQGANIDYFLGDALGSVRQLTNQTGTVSLARNYDPYGNMIANTGEDTTTYGFTSEQTDTSGLVYLRARYYAPTIGRFLSRDSWEGDYYKPLSYNLWLYGYGNPVNLIDSSGESPVYGDKDLCQNVGANQFLKTWLGDAPDYRGICRAKTYINPIPGDYMTTYVAAGIAIQSQWFGSFKDSRNSPFYDCYGTGLGYANVSDAAIATAYKEKIINQAGEWTGGWGLGLAGQDQMDPAVAVQAMRQRIRMVVDECVNANCSSTDIFITAALGQNSSLSWQDFKTVYLPKNERISPTVPNGVTIKWEEMFKDKSAKEFETYFQLKLFFNDVKELHNSNNAWYVPDIDWAEITRLTSGASRFGAKPKY
jgi:RHS repeat-associated protein